MIRFGDNLAVKATDIKGFARCEVNGKNKTKILFQDGEYLIIPWDFEDALKHYEDTVQRYIISQETFVEGRGADYPQAYEKI